MIENNAKGKRQGVWVVARGHADCVTCSSSEATNDSAVVERPAIWLITREVGKKVNKIVKRDITNQIYFERKKTKRGRYKTRYSWLTS